MKARRLASWMCCLPLLAALAAGAADAPALESDTVEEQANEALWYGDFEAVARLMATHREDPERTDADGRRLLVGVRKGLDRVLRYPAKTAAYPANLTALTRQWVDRHPRAPLAHALHVEALVAQAWWYRGGGWAKDVPAQAWADFRTHLDLAREHLSANADIVLQEPLAYSALLTIAKASSYTGSQIAAIARDGLKRHPQEESLYFWWAAALTPKWHGAPLELDGAVHEAVERTRDRRGMEMYARLYSAIAADDVGSRLFEDTAARWPLMQQGFADWLKRQPLPRVRNRWAYTACIAQDRAALQDALDQLEGGPLLAEWGNDPGRTFDTCRRWAHTQ